MRNRQMSHNDYVRQGRCPCPCHQGDRASCFCRGVTAAARDRRASVEHLQDTVRRAQPTPVAVAPDPDPVVVRVWVLMNLGEFEGVFGTEKAAWDWVVDHVAWGDRDGYKAESHSVGAYPIGSNRR